jgi:hypothetical protein
VPALLFPFSPLPARSRARAAAPLPLSLSLTSRCPPSSAAPICSGAYKKVAPSTSFPAPASATTLLPRPSPIRGSAAVVFLSGKPSPPLLPSPLLVQGAIRLAYQLHHIAVNSERYSPTPIPRPELTADSTTSPRTAPSRTPLAKLSPPLGLLDPPRAKATTHCPRTGPPAAGFLPREWPVRPAVNPWRRSPPPPLSLACGPTATASSPRAPAPSPALGRSLAGALARARCVWLGQKSPRPTSAEIPFLFPFSNLFSFN